MVSVVWLFRGSSLQTLQNTKHLRKHIIRYLDAVVGCAMLACDQLEQLQQPILKYVRSHICTLIEEIDLFRKFQVLEQTISTFQNVQYVCPKQASHQLFTTYKFSRSRLPWLKLRKIPHTYMYNKYTQVLRVTKKLLVSMYG